MKFDELKASDVDKAYFQENIILLPIPRHIPRQLMVIDKNDNPVYNCEFPTYPGRAGIYSGNPSWGRTMTDILSDCAQQSDGIAEIYFSGAPVEFEQIKSTIDKLNKTTYKEQPLACFYVRPDLDELLTEARVTAGARQLGIPSREAAKQLIEQDEDNVSDSEDDNRLGLVPADDESDDTPAEPPSQSPYVNLADKEAAANTEQPEAEQAEAVTSATEGVSENPNEATANVTDDAESQASRLLDDLDKELGLTKDD